LGVKVGVVLPTFRENADEAFAVAREAEHLGVDGAFCFDHLWPMGQPERPALAPFPVLAALAAATERITLGTLVARIGLVPNEVLVSEFATLASLAPGRVIAALGTGDSLSRAENEAYGIDFPPAAVRRTELMAGARQLTAASIPVWIGGGSAETQRMVTEAGIDAAVNVWQGTVPVVADLATRSEVTWAGVVPAPGAGIDHGPGDGRGRDGGTGGTDDAALVALLHELAAAGATWAVFAHPAPLGVLVETSRAIRSGR
jgi:hypothetical protein